MEKHDLDKMYAFLDDLRDLGIVNMFAAPWYLQEEFGISDEDSVTIVKNWMHAKEKQVTHTVSLWDILESIEVKDNE